MMLYFINVQEKIIDMTDAGLLGGHSNHLGLSKKDFPGGKVTTVLMKG